MGSTVERAMAREIRPAVTTPERPLGTLLIEAGVVSAADTERILMYHHQHGMRFGEAALRLGLISHEDLQQALAAQHGYPVLRWRDGRVARDVIAAYRPWSPEVEQLRAVRSQLKLRCGRCRALAIVSPNQGEGRSYLASNLAVVFAQLGERTLLVDADMRNSRQHLLFGVQNRAGLSSMLAGRGDEGLVMDVAKMPGLCLLPAGPLPPNPLELLTRPAFTSLLAELTSRFDMVIVDTPPALECADAQHAAAAAGAALMVARKDCTGMSDFDRLCETLLEGGTTLVGAVLNGT
jgi:protein-tyrosine kinase